MPKMPCHITDGPSDPEDAQDQDFAEHQEPDPHDVAQQARLDERHGIQLQVSTAIRYITLHSSFDHIELIGLLKRISRYLAEDRP